MCVDETMLKGKLLSLGIGGDVEGGNYGIEDVVAAVGSVMGGVGDDKRWIWLKMILTVPCVMLPVPKENCTSRERTAYVLRMENGVVKDCKEDETTEISTYHVTYSDNGIWIGNVENVWIEARWGCVKKYLVVPADLSVSEACECVVMGFTPEAKECLEFSINLEESVPFGDLDARFCFCMKDLLKMSGVGGAITLRMDYIGRNEFLDRLTSESESSRLQRCFLKAAENHSLEELTEVELMVTSPWLSRLVTVGGELTIYDVGRRLSEFFQDGNLEISFNQEAAVPVVLLERFKMKDLSLDFYKRDIHRIDVLECAPEDDDEVGSVGPVADMFPEFTEVDDDHNEDRPNGYVYVTCYGHWEEGVGLSGRHDFGCWSSCPVQMMLEICAQFCRRYRKCGGSAGTYGRPDGSECVMLFSFLGRKPFPLIAFPLIDMSSELTMLDLGLLPVPSKCNLAVHVMEEGSQSVEEVQYFLVKLYLPVNWGLEDEDNIDFVEARIYWSWRQLFDHIEERLCLRGTGESWAYSFGDDEGCFSASLTNDQIFLKDLGYIPGAQSFNVRVHEGRTCHVTDVSDGSKICSFSEANGARVLMMPQHQGADSVSDGCATREDLPVWKRSRFKTSARRK